MARTRAAPALLVATFVCACEVPNPAYFRAVPGDDGSVADAAHLDPTTDASADVTGGGAADVGPAADAHMLWPSPDADPAPPDAPLPLSPDAAPPPPPPIDAAEMNTDVALPIIPDAGEPDVAIAQMDSAPPPPELLQGLVSYWSLDEQGGTVAQDLRSGNHGTLEHPDPGLVWRPGRLGGAARFSALDGRAIRVEPSASLDGLSTAMTVAAWVWIESGQGRIMSVLSRQLGDGAAEQYDLMVNDMRPEFFMYDAQRRDHVGAQDATPTLARTWFHLAGTYDGSWIRVYVNGQLRATSAYQTIAWLGADGKPLFIGTNINDGNNNRRETWNGLVDEVVLYDRALSPDEIAMLMTLQRSLLP